MKGLGGLTNPLLNKPNTGAPSSYTSEAPSSPLTNFPLGPNPAHFDFSKRFVPIVSVLTGIAPPGTFASTQFADFEFFNSAQTEVSGDVTYCYCVRVMGTAIIQEASPIYQAILQQDFLDVSKSATTFYLGLRSSLHARYKAARLETMTKDWIRVVPTILKGRPLLLPARSVVVRKHLSTVERCNTLAVKSRLIPVEKHIAEVTSLNAEVTSLNAAPITGQTIMDTMIGLSYLCHMKNNLR